MKIKRIILIMGILSNFLGFSQNENLIELTSKAEEGWKDLVFTITEKEKLKKWILELNLQSKIQK